MRRTFTVELTAREALTVHRMAKLAGVTPDRIVQLLYRTPIFRAVTGMATGPWEFWDHQARRYVRNRRYKLRQFEEWSRDLIHHAEAVPPEQTIQQRTQIAPGQA